MSNCFEVIASSAIDWSMSIACSWKSSICNHELLEETYWIELDHWLLSKRKTEATNEKVRGNIYMAMIVRIQQK